jgi:hypothetical protein
MGLRLIELLECFMSCITPCLDPVVLRPPQLCPNADDFQILRIDGRAI